MNITIRIHPSHLYSLNFVTIPERNKNTRFTNNHPAQTVGSMLLEEWKEKSGVFLSITISLNKLTPSPKNRLNNGPAMHPVRAIFAYPFFATDELATMSPTELPHARTVIPKKDWFMLSTIPSMVNRSIKMLATHHIQTSDIRKHKNAYKVMNLLGACCCFVVQ